MMTMMCLNTTLIWTDLFLNTRYVGHTPIVFCIIFAIHAIQV